IPYLEERKSLWAIAQPKFISPLPLGYALYTLEEGDFFRKYVKTASNNIKNHSFLLYFNRKSGS
ncbi:hypothetical protein NC797_14820, partial [Aquibacillus sp. 3ASR75-11]